MEFRYGLWTGISGLMGEDGRQLGEANTRPMIFNREIPAEVHACKYKGSRYGKDINVSALRVAMRHFYEASSITVAVRDYHMAKLNKPADEQPGGWDLYMISRAAIALISHRYRYGNTRFDEKIPNDISSLYKLVTGVFVICREMMRSAYPAIKTNSPISSQELFDFADENYIFRSDNDMVCAGSTAKIIEFLEFANIGMQHPEASRLELVGEFDYLTFLRNYVDDLDSWYQYAQYTVELDHFIELETLRRKFDADPDRKTTVQPVMDICREQHDYWLSLIGDRQQFRVEGFEQGVLARQNAILALLNWEPIKSIPEKVIQARLCQ